MATAIALPSSISAWPKLAVCGLPDVNRLHPHRCAEIEPSPARPTRLAPGCTLA